MVLRHHPDKRRGAGEEIRDDDDYFTCITKAYEILGDPLKRRSYDSVDPEFDDDVPVINAYNKTHFFEVCITWIVCFYPFCCMDSSWVLITVWCLT